MEIIPIELNCTYNYLKPSLKTLTDVIAATWSWLFGFFFLRNCPRPFSIGDKKNA